VKSALNPSPVVITEATNARDHIVNVLFTDFLGAEDYLSLGEAGFRGTTKV